jgi:hypothetical protein
MEEHKDLIFLAEVISLTDTTSGLFPNVLTPTNIITILHSAFRMITIQRKFNLYVRLFFKIYIHYEFIIPNTVKPELTTIILESRLPHLDKKETSEQRPPITNSHYFWMVVVHKFDCTGVIFEKKGLKNIRIWVAYYEFAYKE